METKICNKCCEAKSLCDFSKDAKSKDGLQRKCKLCTKKYRDENQEKLVQYKKEYYHDNKEKILEDKKNYILANKEKVNLSNKIYRESNQEKINEWKSNNREHILKYNKSYQKENSDKISKRAKTYKQNNYDKILEYNKKYRLNNKHTIAWRMLIHTTLRRMGKTKEGHTIDLLGYSALELKQHIESLFTEGMSWDNYGEWHIDHIKGIVNWETNTPPNIVNALSNLRPMWATKKEINGVLYEGNLNRPKYNH